MFWYLSAGAVRLDVDDVLRAQARLGEGLARQLLLHGARGERDALLLAAVRVHARVVHGGVHAPRRAAPLQQHGHHGLRAHVALAAGVERRAAPVRRQHAEPVEVERVAGLEAQVGAGHYGGVAVARAHGRERLRQREQRAGAGRVDGVRGALQVERVRDAVGEHGAAAAREPVAVDLVGVLRPHLLGLGVGDADVDAGARAAQLGGVEAGVDDGLMRALQQQPQLRVHEVRLLRVHAEKRRVKVLQVFEFAIALREPVQPCTTNTKKYSLTKRF